jgi:hypothetical protein
MVFDKHQATGDDVEVKDTMARLWMVLAWMPLAITLPQVSRTDGPCLACALSALRPTVTLVGWTFDRIELARWVVGCHRPARRSACFLCLALAPLRLARPAARSRAGLSAAGSSGPDGRDGVRTRAPRPRHRPMAAGRPQHAGLGVSRAHRGGGGVALGMLRLALLGPTLLRRSRLAASMVAVVIGRGLSGTAARVRWGVGVSIAVAELSLPTTACIVMLGANTLGLLQWQAAVASQDAPVSASARYTRRLPAAMVLPAAVWLQHRQPARLVGQHPGIVPQWRCWRWCCGRWWCGARAGSTASGQVRRPGALGNGSANARPIGRLRRPAAHAGPAWWKVRRPRSSR